jgi:hypothetical protein
LFDCRKELDADRAWLEHDPARGYIPTEIWRRLRSIKRGLEPTARRIENMLGQEALIRTLIVQREILEITWLSPKGPIIEDAKNGEQQNCLLACHALCFPLPIVVPSISARPGRSRSPDHASGRLLQRSPGVNLCAVVLDGALAFANADASVVELLVGTDKSVYLAAGAGAFVGHIIRGRTKSKREYVYMRCRTWMPTAWLGADQALLPRASNPREDGCITPLALG